MTKQSARKNDLIGTERYIKFSVKPGNSFSDVRHTLENHCH